MKNRVEKRHQKFVGCRWQICETTIELAEQQQQQFDE